MRIGIQSWGTEGDIRPLLALGRGLHEAGHDVTAVVTNILPKNYDPVSEELGFPIYSVGTPVVESESELREIEEEMMATASPVKQSRTIIDRGMKPAMEVMWEAGRSLAAESDLFVGHHFLHLCTCAAEAEGIPHASVMLAPTIIPSRNHSPEGMPRMRGWLARLGWWLARKVVNAMYLEEINEWRHRAGLEPWSDVMTQAWMSPALNLVATSPQICPDDDSWSRRHHICGFFELPDDGAAPVIPDRLQGFLDPEIPPVYLTFGSLTPRRKESLDELMALVHKGLETAGCPAVIQLPPEFLGRYPDTDRLLHIGAVSHAAVFPRCRAVIHHGGAGTTHAVCTAGVPSVVIPHVADQFYWGHRLRSTGIAPKPLDRRKLTPGRLADRIRTVTDSADMQERAKSVSEAMKREDGVAAAVEQIELLARSN